MRLNVFNLRLTVVRNYKRTHVKGVCVCGRLVNRINMGSDFKRPYLSHFLTQPLKFIGLNRATRWRQLGAGTIKQYQETGIETEVGGNLVYRYSN